MKATAKRILATLLAALMIFGVFAVAASAIDEEEPEVEVLAGPAYDALTPNQKADLNTKLLACFVNYQAFMDKEQVYKAAWLFSVLQLVKDQPRALKDGVVVTDFNAAVAAALGTADNLTKDFWIMLRDTFERSDAAVAAYLDGKLQEGLAEAFSTFLAAYIANLEPLVTDNVRPEVVDAAKNYAQWVKAFWAIQLGKLGNLLKNWALKFLEIVRKRVWNKIVAYVQSANWDALRTRVGALVKAYNDGTNALKLIWDWIIEFLFGWAKDLF